MQIMDELDRGRVINEWTKKRDSRSGKIWNHAILFGLGAESSLWNSESWLQSQCLVIRLSL